MRALLERLKPRTLLQKELVFNLLLAAIALTLLTGIFLAMHRSAFRRQLALRAESLATLMAREAEFPMLVKNTAELQRLAQSAVSGEDVAYATITLADGTVISVDRKSNNPSVQRLVEIQKSVTPTEDPVLPDLDPAGGRLKTLGFIRVGISLKQQEVLFARTVRCAISTAALAFAGILLLQYIRLRRWLYPLRELVASAERVGQGDLSACAAPRLQDEIGELARAFNRMVDGLRAYRDGLTERSAQLELANARLEESEERYMLAVQGAKDGIWDWDLRQQKVYYSPRWKAMLGYTDQEIDGGVEEWLSRVHPDDRAEVEAGITAHLSGETPHFESEHRVRHNDGGYRWMLSRGQAVRLPDGRPSRIAGSQTDITDNKVLDPLTGLPNRILLKDRLSVSIERACRNPDYQFAFFFLDLDGFKLVNDSLGHLLGDQLLAGVAQRLQECVRGSDSVARPFENYTAARLGGDEFGLLIDDVKDLGNAVHVAERVLRALELPFELEGHRVVTSGSIGIAMGAKTDQEPADVLRNADIAMYRAKLRGKGCYELFDENMRKEALARLDMEIELRRAVENHEFVVYYQPKVSLEDESIEDLEALIRWQHPTLGLVPPSKFIPLAEETGMIVAIGKWMLREACRQGKQWHTRFPSVPPISVSANLSPRQFREADLVDQIARTLRETGLDPGRLNLEITESTVMDNPDAALITLNKLKEMGVRLSMDDFGTGYSSLNCLHQFPFDTLKIDRSFIQNMENDEASAEIVSAVITLGNRLGLSVVAEGLETREQLLRLKSMGCPYGQGYYFSKAVEAHRAGQLIQRQVEMEHAHPAQYGAVWRKPEAA